ncbi:putative reverse transcriptase domain-containing protein [Tanacetum coccineum]|uniref:Reverse transcriptase domain-containing protein n=1 Tax=Tanacetum coccineum TaxID=301880 RepID=A0ABQ4YIQ3_9ASTR
MVSNVTNRNNNRITPALTSRDNLSPGNAQAMTTASCHMARDCKGKAIATGANARPTVTCYDCGEKGHTRNYCPKRRDPQVRLDTSYEVELADGRVASTNTILRGRTLNLLNHLFKIDLMPTELGTFELVIGMDWLVDQDAVIVCGKKVVHIPVKNKTLVVEGDRSTSRLKIISCIKASKYIERGHQLFVAHVTEKEPKEKHFEDVSVTYRDSHHLGKWNLKLNFLNHHGELHMFVKKKDGHHYPECAVVFSELNKLTVKNPVSTSEDYELFINFKVSKACTQEIDLRSYVPSAPILALRAGTEKASTCTCESVAQDHKSLRKANVVADALSRKDREPIRVRSLVMMVHTNLPERILNAPTDAMKEENVKAENLGRLIKPIFKTRSDGI